MLQGLSIDKTIRKRENVNGCCDLQLALTCCMTLYPSFGFFLILNTFSLCFLLLEDAGLLSSFPLHVFLNSVSLLLSVNV